MIDFRMEGIEEQADFVGQTRLRILAGIREGMAEGMQGLAGAVASRLHGDPIAERTGDLVNAVLRSPRVVETETYIKGEVTTQTAKFRNLGLWLEFGTKYPTKGKGLARYPKQFLIGTIGRATPESIKSNGHGAFHIEPKPFFNPAFEEYYPTILDTINERIAEAVDAGV